MQTISAAIKARSYRAGYLKGAKACGYSLLNSGALRPWMKPRLKAFFDSLDSWAASANLANTRELPPAPNFRRTK